MSENERMELRALRPDGDTRERVVGGAMERIRGTPRPAGAPAALAGSARYLWPVLAAAAAVALLLLAPSGGEAPDRELQGAGVLLEMEGNVPDPWLRWSLAGEEPDPREVLVRFAGAP